MTAPALARCTGDGACPVRFRTGPPRPCPDHADSLAPALDARIEQWTGVLEAAPGDHDDSRQETTP
jgi:hypothetical protein